MAVRKVECETVNKVGDWVFVMDDAEYPGQDMKWTETMHPTTIKRGEKLYHYSDYEIEEFKAKETCFFSSTGSFGHAYEFTAERDMDAMVSPIGEEVRIELVEQMSLRYVGYFELINKIERRF